MTGDLIKRLTEEGEREDENTPDQWKRLGDIARPAAVALLGADKLAVIEPPKPTPTEQPE